ncbi:MAG: methionyl-tRNA formyltransferase [Acidimicrobiia bacterium]|nr:methionyl-tRNA formyltransferase [Acidimicrobiia bacterium]
MSPLPLPPSTPGGIRRVAFLGTPSIAVPTLRAIHHAGFEIPLVVSGADKRRGRGRELSATPVKAEALDLGLAVSAKVDDLLDVHAEDPIDLAVVVAFGQLIRPHVLAEIPMVNIHFSPLPRWRGAAPVERALLAGDTKTAICIMTVAEGLDEGDIWAQLDVSISPDDTLFSLWDSMSVDGAALLVDQLKTGFTDPQPQVGEPVYARKVHTDDLLLDWERPASELLRVVRVGNAWTTLSGDRFKIHDAEVVDSALPSGEIRDLVVGTGEGGLRLVTVQPANKPRLDASAWANGAQPDGMSFGG